MHCASSPARYLLTILAVFFLPGVTVAGDEFSFSLEEIEKDPVSWGGHLELLASHLDIDQDAAFSFINRAGESDSSLDLLQTTLQLEGSYDRERSGFLWRLQASGLAGLDGWYDTADVMTAYATWHVPANSHLSLGKKSYRWGKGYAWNPVGFINRRKDPNNPDEPLEGYITAEADIVRSFSGNLQTASLSMVLLPVYNHLNDEFGERDNLELATRLYFLFMNTDIDLLLLTGGARPTSYGMDFSTNLASNLEIHGEVAWIRNQRRQVLREDGEIVPVLDDTLSWLLGIRYLSRHDITTIGEYYHNGNGYTDPELENFFRFIHEASETYSEDAAETLLSQAIDMSLKGYAVPQPGRDYLYMRISQKEPFDILYFTPAVTAIVNLGDRSFSLTPELIYTGFTDWELRLRCSFLAGSSYSEFGEKQNDSKVELRIRYFF